MKEVGIVRRMLDVDTREKKKRAVEPKMDMQIIYDTCSVEREQRKRHGRMEEEFRRYRRPHYDGTSQGRRLDAIQG